MMDMSSSVTEKRGSRGHHHHHHHHPLEEKSAPVAHKSHQSLSTNQKQNRNRVEISRSTTRRRANVLDSSNSQDVRARQKLAFGTPTTVSDTVTTQSHNLNSGLEGQSSKQTRISKTTETTTTFLNSSQSRTRNQFSDYSSGEELDFEEKPKTDYTYSRSASYIHSLEVPYEVPSPNMSRARLSATNRSHMISYKEALFGNSALHQLRNHGYISDTAMHAHNSQSVNTHTSTVETNSSSSKLYSNQNTWSENNNKKFDAVNLNYGLLDYESDEDEVTNFYNQRVFQKKSILRSFVEKLSTPIVSTWLGVWKLIYWFISYALLLDTWLLSRRIINKAFPWAFLLLLPFLFFLGKALLAENSSDITDTLSYLTLPAVSLGSFSSIFSSSVAETEIPLACSNLPANQIDSNLHQLILNIVENQKTQLSQAQVEGIIRSVVQQEMEKFGKEKKADATELKYQAMNFTAQNEQLVKLQNQVQLVLAQSQNLAEELKQAKNKILQEQKTDREESLNRLQGLEMELDSLKDNLRHLQETQAALVSSMRNCCRNYTHESAAVEEKVASILMQVMGKGPGSRAERSEFMAFSDWLKSYFVTQKDFDSKLSISTAKITKDLKQEKTMYANASFGESSFISEDYVKKIVKDALLLYDADKTGLTDYALESAGGSVISTRCSETYHSGAAQFTLFGIPVWSASNSPRTVIQPGMHPGECWAFKGSEGYIVIQLSGSVRPTAFSIEHIPRSLAPNGNIDSAPKDFSIYGLTTEKDSEGVLIGRYVYEVDGDSLQYFPVKDPDIEPFNIIELRIHSNHGNLEYTCLYRFRVHGQLLHY